jgi:hypothetical protein
MAEFALDQIDFLKIKKFGTESSPAGLILSNKKVRDRNLTFSLRIGGQLSETASESIMHVPIPAAHWHYH